MDFMNFMNQINNGGCCNHNNHGCNNNIGCDSGFSNNNFCGSSIIPFLFLSGLGQNFCGGNNNNSNVVCYPNALQQYVTQTSSPYCESPVRYRTRKVKQAYMEVPVSTYQVVQPYNQPGPISLNMAGNNNRYQGFDLATLLLFMLLGNRSCRPQQQICHPIPQPRGGSCSTTEL